jgi:flagellar biosynthesis/type III secretory pathway protein FliH
MAPARARATSSVASSVAGGADEAERERAADSQLSPYMYGVWAKEWKARGMEPIIIEELARMLEDRAEAKGRHEGEQIGRREGEQIGRREGEEIGRREGEEIGRREGEETGRRQAVADLAEAYGIALDDRRWARIAGASLAELDAIRAALKRDRAWPD